ncbi:MAG TPA: MFS transporter [Candidatus Dormibacteraeota bacterium]|nr:MFS transporter [Candidatus Dormibacteraeota bacterium]
MTTRTLVERRRAPSYRELLLLEGFAPLAAAALCARVAISMGQVTVVLLVLQQYRSPGLAGLAVCMSIGPGLLVSPLAGALLDRHPRVLLIRLDHVVAAVSMLTIAALSGAGRLSPWMLLTALAVSSLTAPLSDTGSRAMLPAVVPCRLWDKANALDSGGYVLAALLGPPLGGALIASSGPAVAIVVIGMLYAAAALCVGGVLDPRRDTTRSGALTGRILDGLGYVVHHRVLRGLAVCVSLRNLGPGVLVVALPALAVQRLHAGPEVIGLLFAVLGVAGMVSGVASGSASTVGRERNLLAAAVATSALGLAVVATSDTMVQAVTGMVVIGLSTGPLDVSLFSLRQRCTDADVQGRAFAVSMSLNYLGLPLGSALAGPLVQWSAQAALGIAAAVTAAAAVLGLVLLPRTVTSR